MKRIIVGVSITVSTQLKQVIDVIVRKIGVKCFLCCYPGQYTNEPSRAFVQESAVRICGSEHMQPTK